MIRNDIVRVYREVHSWVGILSGLFLFIAFYAGALSMFEEEIQRWASPPLQLEYITPIEQSQDLIDAVIQKHPGAAKNFNIILNPSPEYPARMHWQERDPGADDHAPAVNYFADFGPNKELIVSKEKASIVGQLIDTIHQQVGILIDHELAMPITGIVSALYALALVSGLIILLPTLLKDLFALRLAGKFKRKWLDIHNLLGVFSFPFHLVMALTAVVFALHDYFYGSQMVTIHKDSTAPRTGPPAVAAPSTDSSYYPIDQLLKDLAVSAPEFKPEILNYRQGRGEKPKHMLFVAGKDPRHHASRPRHGLVNLNAFTGEILATDYMPGRQEALQATVSSFFALHFGNYGGSVTQWIYFILGLAGAMLFYSGNLLWIEAKRKQNRNKQGFRSDKLLYRLSIGVSLGCIAGISSIIAAAKLFPAHWQPLTSAYTSLYYLVFFACIAIALLPFKRDASGMLLIVCAFSSSLIPLSSLLALNENLAWNHADSTVLVDLLALSFALSFAYLGFKRRNMAT